MSLEIAPDGRVFYIERLGRVRIWKPDTRETVDAATIPVHSERDNGLLGVALDPTSSRPTRSTSPTLTVSDGADQVSES